MSSTSVRGMWSSNAFADAWSVHRMAKGAVDISLHDGDASSRRIACRFRFRVRSGRDLDVRYAPAFVQKQQPADPWSASTMRVSTVHE